MQCLLSDDPKQLWKVKGIFRQVKNSKTTLNSDSKFILHLKLVVMLVVNVNWQHPRSANSNRVQTTFSNSTVALVRILDLWYIKKNWTNNMKIWNILRITHCISQSQRFDNRSPMNDLCRWCTTLSISESMQPGVAR